jgi:lipopolysaccharide/colanic/teichoic acid biosynthesis glycosyltransferase
MLKRGFDILFSFFGFLLLLPVLILISVMIILDSKGGIFYQQKRVGLDGKLFGLLKFRTMHTGADKQGLLTIGSADNRITSTGLWLRKYKLDELPQLINILKGDMSFVGPRPEVPKYVNHYTPDQRKVLAVKPGLTDPASLAYLNESDLLAQTKDPEQYYILFIMPAKIELNLNYISQHNLSKDISIILRTIGMIFRGSKL